ncbi:putative bifunctional diguanylate cyclase/phosphodiesterase [Bremerella cremea]|uniref:putative bifunctional diguanylate cyclase/phosphodiesterase n=1 Tax=Bremerella cremea TaxID=1031537 RepID=UPI0031EADB75
MTNDPMPTENLIHQAIQDKAAGERFRRKMWTDLVVLTLVGVAVLGLCIWFDVFELVAEMSKAHDNWEVDEMVIAMNVFAVVGFIFFIRRYRESLQLLKERNQMLAELIFAQQTIELDKINLRNAALSDFLTGLPNRAWLLEYLERYSLSGHSTILVFFDIDGFKQANDLHGHHVGDELLREIGRRSLEVFGLPGGLPALESSRAVARLGGDEFVAVVRDIDDIEKIRSLVSQLETALSLPYYLQGANISATASIGVVLQGDLSEGTEKLLADADAAMYQAKSEGRGRTKYFEPTMRERLTRRARLSADLRDAIRFNQLHVFYHPILSLNTGRLEGAEALLRWTHPIMGPISPAEFVPIAEDTELIFDLGTWVLQESLHQMALWVKDHPHTAPELISVNVSRKQFSDPHMIEKFRTIIESSDVPTERIQLEITEDLGDKDMELVIDRMHQLKQMGVKIAIDDFGTGTSTFAAIESFPIDTIKLDMSLVSRIVNSFDRAAIVHSLAILVRNLNVKMVAEGVEVPQQISVLQELGCHSAQGFYFSKPLSAEDFEAQFELFAGNSFTVEGYLSFPSPWKERLTAFKELNGV